MQLSESVSCNIIYFFFLKTLRFTVGRGPETGNQLRVALVINLILILDQKIHCSTEVNQALGLTIQRCTRLLIIHEKEWNLGIRS
jgi:hypothetical protein